MDLIKESDKLATLKALVKSLGLSIIEPPNSTREQATLDFIIYHPSWKVRVIQMNFQTIQHLKS